MYGLISTAHVAVCAVLLQTVSLCTLVPKAPRNEKWTRCHQSHLASPTTSRKSNPTASTAPRADVWPHLHCGRQFYSWSYSVYVLHPISAFSPPRVPQAAHRMALQRGACVRTTHGDGACDSWGWTHHCAGVSSDDNHAICAVSSLRPTSQRCTTAMLQGVSLATSS